MFMHPRYCLVRLLPLCASLVLAATASAELPLKDWDRTETRDDCASYDALRSPFFGETHIHTGFSGDAAFVRVRTTAFGSARRMVTGTTFPSGSNTWVMPTFFVIRPGIALSS